MAEPEESLSRRPLKSRSTAWARSLAGGLCRLGVAPNLISAFSVGFAVVAAAGFVMTRNPSMSFHWAGWLLVIAGIQLRLLCNLMDGMVAVEGHRRSVTGELWNEIPDRIADAIILVAAGIACGLEWLGVLTALGALLTAYLRALGASLTGFQDFRGPMAKPHRMAALTIAAFLGLIFPSWSTTVLSVALAVIAGGLVITCWRRVALLAARLKSHPKL